MSDNESVLRDRIAELDSAIRAISLNYHGSCQGGGLPLIDGVRACTTGLGDAIKLAERVVTAFDPAFQPARFWDTDPRTTGERVRGVKL